MQYEALSGVDASLDAQLVGVALDKTELLRQGIARAHMLSRDSQRDEYGGTHRSHQLCLTLHCSPTEAHTRRGCLLPHSARPVAGRGGA
jgi:hypothetical protein